jgi:hypothetical protein
MQHVDGAPNAALAVGLQALDTLALVTLLPFNDVQVRLLLPRFLLALLPFNDVQVASHVLRLASAHLSWRLAACRVPRLVPPCLGSCLRASVPPPTCLRSGQLVLVGLGPSFWLLLRLLSFSPCMRRRGRARARRVRVHAGLPAASRRQRACGLLMLWSTMLTCWGWTCLARHLGQGSRLRRSRPSLGT